MDDISRELPPDSTSADAGAHRGKGPDELVAFERSQVAEHQLGGGAVGRAVSGRPPEPAPSGDAGDAAPPAGPRFRLPPERADDGDDGATIDAAAAAAALAAEAEAVEVEEDLGPGDDEGLPAVPELADAAAVAKVVFVLMLTSREGLSLLRLAQACNTTQKMVTEALELLQADLRGLGLPVELARTGDVVKWMSGPDTFPYLQRLRGVKKLEKLSPAALETLAVIAYRQPVMRSEIEAIRGVKAGPMLRTLLQHRLVKVTGRADVPGRPLQYGTTQQFLERFGLASLQELPSIKEWKNLG
ncbi:MAG: SMC-Scp complex subunit ScpB [Planctomycetes bacterium]|nr:SMC-Scp complex subunit ScpB [Planctomycetota bacterium]